MTSLAVHRRKVAVTYGGRSRRRPQSASWSELELHSQEEEERSAGQSDIGDKSQLSHSDEAVDPFAFVVEDEADEDIETDGEDTVQLSQKSAIKTQRRQASAMRRMPSPPRSKVESSRTRNTQKDADRAAGKAILGGSVSSPKLKRRGSTGETGTRQPFAGSIEANSEREIPKAGTSDIASVPRTSAFDARSLDSPLKQRLVDTPINAEGKGLCNTDDVGLFDFVSDNETPSPARVVRSVMAKRKLCENAPVSPTQKRANQATSLKGRNRSDAAMWNTNPGDVATTISSPSTPTRGRIFRMKSADGTSPSDAIRTFGSTSSDTAITILERPAQSTTMDVDDPPSPTRVTSKAECFGSLRVAPVRSKTVLDDLDEILSAVGSCTNSTLRHQREAVATQSTVMDAATSTASPRARNRIGRMKSAGGGSDDPFSERMDLFGQNLQRCSSQDGDERMKALRTGTSKDDTPVQSNTDSTAMTNVDDTFTMSSELELDEVDAFFASDKSTAPLQQSGRSSTAPVINSSSSSSVIEPPTPLVRHAVGITYARTRSYLETHEDVYAPKYISESQRRRDEGLESSSDEEDQDRREVKSIHELREAGEAKRFADHMEYTLDGFREDQPLGVRRSSALELAKKVLSGKFTLKMRALGFISRFYELVHLVEDPLLVAMISFIMCALLQDRRNLEQLVGEKDLVDFMAKAMQLIPDPLIGTPRSKYEKRLVSEIKHIIEASNFLKCYGDKVTTRYIALQSLSAIASFRPRTMPFIQQRLRATGALDIVLRTLHTGVAAMNQALSDATHQRTQGRMALLVSKYQPNSSIMHINLLCLSIVEFSTLVCRENLAYIVETEGCVNDLMQIVAWSSAIARSCEEFCYPGSKILAATFSVLVNLTNDHEGCSDLIGEGEWLGAAARCAIVPNPLLTGKEAQSDSQPPVDSNGTQKKSSRPLHLHEESHDDESKADAEEKAKLTNFDIMLLGVAFMINVVERNTKNQDRIRSLELSLQCPGDECLCTCQCADRQSTVACVADVVNERLEAESEQATHEILTAQLTMLLGLLIKAHPSNRSLALTHMKKHDQSFETAIALLENFAGWYDAMLTASENSVEGAGVDIEMYGAREAGRAVKEIVEVFKGQKL
ncbi:uncharacterized protein SPPG_01033 [Spizellomyces punctatus DAOM BR117]|uniref:WAPL domain-containing protein n=1 Tax=Spizellomyces punctatus (strain DAOM BR117) TaxID=645134 RepID=A0A0L0HR66_SPIPD|nr:uncharacterized protein SPPG_01033 [Spizellomyces punctatus DAOM BR117]KND03558.1 hypothetical protein SPPG_01033 [Spizellomyces punctatus DAOM BR117]|eukprot:XP_016611597.1 hypothetical protein SPPG_01033 [Spizellomyces punctatus DAOM BR117]